RHEPRSDLPFTDDERELRNRSWSIVMPTGPRAEFERMIVEMRRTRIFPARWTQTERSSYAIRLAREPYTSPTARYHRLRDDIETERALMPAFFAAAQRVIAADMARERALTQIRAVSPREREDAMARVAETRIVIWWAQQTLRERVGSYTYALER